MSRVCRSSIVLILAACVFSTHASHAEVAPAFSHFSVVEGLSQNSVWTMLRDKQGFFWFGTDDGLNKYDGYRFVMYRNKQDDSTSLVQNTIRAMIQDRNGLIWIGTSGGLDIYNPATDNFTHVSLPIKGPVPARGIVVTSLAEDAHGNIWVGTRFYGLFRFGADRSGVKNFLHDPADHASISVNAIRTLYVDRTGVLWIGTEGAGLDRFVESTGSFVLYQVDKTQPGSLRDNNIMSLYEDSKGRFWIGTMYDGIAQFDRSSGRCTYYTKPIVLSDNRMDTLTVLTISEDKHGRILFGTFGGGLQFLHPESGTITAWRNDIRNPRSISSDFIMALYRDEIGCLWIGTYTNGICRYDPEGEHFQTYRNEIPNTSLFTDNNMRAICRDRSGLVWIGSTKGLNIYNLSTGANEKYTADASNSTTLNDNYILSIFEDSKGVMWIGTRKGLNTFDRRTKRAGRFSNETKYPRGIASLNVRVIAEDSSGILWFGTSDGLVSYDRQRQAFKTYLPDKNNPRSIGSENIRSLCVDHSGTLWIGTYGAGISRYDRRTDGFKNYPHDPNNPHSVSNDLAAPIIEDQRGMLWIGTYGGGINKFDPRTEQFKAYREIDGLTNNTIFGLQADGRGNIWITTNRGVSCLNPATESFRNYTTAAGLQGEEFNLNSSFKDRAGTVFFGGNFGLNVFNPDKIRDNRFVPPVYIVSLSIFNKRAHFDTAMSMKKSIVLSYDENSISLEFVALNYRKPELNQYKYQLVGFDKEWIQSGTDRKASYTNLLPGEYVFRVTGSNNDGVWNPDVTSLVIIVKPPFWRTWWAYVLYIIALGSLLAGVLEYAQRRQRRRLMIEQHRREAEVVRQKNTKLKEANDEILRQQEILKERNEQIETANRELKHEIEQRELLLTELKAALENVKTLGGLIPICSSCKKIRDDEGYWNILETYLIKHSDAQFSHGICPDCAGKLYPQYKHKFAHGPDHLPKD
ncbi:MAG TPA: two-component regulator propeller domain-containing protein [Bacteroidota bacterium]|nr:two-component regulator propeller domain-containing protein [Bacteroidota bacterium]